MTGNEYINTRPLTLMVHRIQNSSRLTTVFNQINESCRLGLKFEFPENVLTTAKRINLREVREKKYKPKGDKKSIINWAFGEFKIFVWIIVYKCIINGFSIQDFSLEIAQEIQSILKSKTVSFIQYELKLLVSQKFNVFSETWSEEESAMLTEILLAATAKKPHINWRATSFELYRRSDGRFFRDINHCREKWYNHLNPSVRKGPWLVEEDQQIFALVQMHGYRWAAISRGMGNTRTEHMVKNRFFKFIREWKVTTETPKEVVCELFRTRHQRTISRKRAPKKPRIHQTNPIAQNMSLGEMSPCRNERIMDSGDLQDSQLGESHEPILSSKQVKAEEIEEAEEQHVSKQHPSSNETDRVKEETIIKTEPNEVIAPIKLQEKAAREIEVKIEEEGASGWPSWGYYPFINMYCSPFPF